MPNGNGGMALKLFKAVFGDVPAQWIRLIVIGGLIVWAGYQVRDFLRNAEAFQERVAVDVRGIRRELRAAIVADSLVLEANDRTRAKLLGKVNTRFSRLYINNGWEYEPIEPPER